MTELILFGAGSVNSCFKSIEAHYAAAAGVVFTRLFKSAGLLRSKIEAGAPCDIFASANMRHPVALQAAGYATDVHAYAGNRLCMVARPEAALTAQNAGRNLARADILIGTSTRQIDPCGDFAWDMLLAINNRYGNIISLTPEKVLEVTGGLGPKPVHTSGISDYTFSLINKVDVLILYENLADKVVREYPGSKKLYFDDPLPQISVNGIAAIKSKIDEPQRLAPVGTSRSALTKFQHQRNFIDCVLSECGQSEIAAAGLIPLRQLTRFDRLGRCAS